VTNIGAVTVLFPVFQQRLLREPYDWAADNVRVALLRSAPPLGAETFADVQSRQVRTGGYVAGGKPVTGKYVIETGQAWLCYAEPVSWRTRGRLSASDAVLYCATGAREVLVWVAFGETVRAGGGGSFNLTWGKDSMVMKIHHAMPA
jgi:hypothetical protein